MKTYGTIILVMVIMLALPGCGGATPTPTPQPEANTAFKVALLLPRAVDADGWTQAGYTGLLMIEEELGAEIAYSEAVPEEDFEKVFGQYAEDGYDFVIGHGAQFVPAAELAAEAYPETDFAVVTPYGGNNNNLGALAFREGELGYLAGVVASLKTDSNQVAYLSGKPYEVGLVNSALFTRGATETNPEVEVTISWVESWTDEEKAVQLAQQLIDAGVDVILVNTAESDPAVIALAESAGIYVIGWSSDKYDMAPDSVLTSGVQETPVLLLQGATLSMRGQWQGKQYNFGLLDNAHFLAPFNDLISPEEREKLETVKQEIIAGNIDVTP